MRIGRQKRPLDRNENPDRDTRLIVLAVEGEKTEEIYFKALKQTRVQVRVIPSENGRSAPKYILEAIQAYRTQYEIGDGDELWVVIDRDRWPVRSLRDIAQICNQQSLGLAVSTPCFEYWLCLHLEIDPPNVTTARSLSRHLAGAIGAFRKDAFDPSSLISGLDRAVNRARALDQPAGQRWPLRSGSHVYKVIDSIFNI